MIRRREQQAIGDALQKEFLCSEPPIPVPYGQMQRNIHDTLMLPFHRFTAKDSESIPRKRVDSLPASHTCKARSAIPAIFHIFLRLNELKSNH